MPPITHQGSHQGTLRGSVVLPIETGSDGEMGYKTARSDLDSSAASSEAGDPPPKYTSPKQQRMDDSKQHEHEQPEIEVEELPDDYMEPTNPPKPHSAKVNTAGLRNKSEHDEPAHVEPIGKIPRIPPLSADRTSQHNSQTTTPPPEEDNAMPKKKLPLHQIPKDHLVGKKIDEYGDIVDTDGTVLGRVEGDLPSMVGRSISNARGDVVGDDGELLGYVAAVGSGEDDEDDDENKANETGKPQSDAKRTISPPPKPESPTWSLAEVMQAMAAAGKTGPGGLRVDARGNIFDSDGEVVGSFHDNATGWGRKNKSGAGTGASPSGGRSSGGATPRPGTGTHAPQPSKPQAAPATTAANPSKTGSGGGSSSQAKGATNDKGQTVETKEETPSDLFLDVKSTMEGIQLTIRIPTMFNGGKPLEPKIVFS